MSAAKIKLDKYAHLGTHKIFFKTLRQARMMFTIFVVFSLCWSPYVFVLLLDKDDDYPLEAHLLTSLIAHLHASLNFIIYGVNNKTFREGYMTILLGRLPCCQCCKQEKTVQRDVTSVSTCYDDLTSPIFDDQQLADGFCNCLQNETKRMPSKEKCDENIADTKTLTPLSPLYAPNHVNGFLPNCQTTLTHPTSPKSAKDIDTSSI